VEQGPVSYRLRVMERDGNGAIQDLVVTPLPAKRVEGALVEPVRATLAAAFKLRVVRLDGNGNIRDLVAAAI
jgi:hypothetical protein